MGRLQDGMWDDCSLEDDEEVCWTVKGESIPIDKLTDSQLKRARHYCAFKPYAVSDFVKGALYDEAESRGLI